MQVKIRGTVRTARAFREPSILSDPAIAAYFRGKDLARGLRLPPPPQRLVMLRDGPCEVGSPEHLAALRQELLAELQLCDTSQNLTSADVSVEASGGTEQQEAEARPMNCQVAPKVRQLTFANPDAPPHLVPLRLDLDTVAEALQALADREPQSPVLRYLAHSKRLGQRMSKLRALRFLYAKLEADPRITHAVEATMARFGVSERTCWRWLKGLTRRAGP